MATLGHLLHNPPAGFVMSVNVHGFELRMQATIEHVPGRVLLTAVRAAYVSCY